MDFLIAALITAGWQASNATVTETADGAHFQLYEHADRQGWDARWETDQSIDFESGLLRFNYRSGCDATLGVLFSSGGELWKVQRELSETADWAGVEIELSGGEGTMVPTRGLGARPLQLTIDAPGCELEISPVEVVR